MNSEQIKRDNFKIEPALYLVPTPIGNLEDITLRALKTLSAVDIVACEDTRHSGILFKSLNINVKKTESYHEHNEESKSEYLIGKLKEGLSIALVTDAGSPGISDPGYRLVRKAVNNSIKVIALPGATAFVPALTASGLPTDSFIFAGFPPHKKGRKTFFENLKNMEMTVVLYESPYRIEKMMEEILFYHGSDRTVCIAREISKLHESFIRGTADYCLQEIKKSGGLKGEIVVIIEGYKKK